MREQYRIINYLIFFSVIEEANWLSLADDINHLIGEGFDAVICLGNSFAHMPDSVGDQREQKYAFLALNHIEYVS